MKIEEYRAYLQSKDLPVNTIDKQLSIIGDFVSFLTDPDSEDAMAKTGKEEVERFARKLIAEGSNTYENFSILRDYSNWLGQRNLYVALVEVVECGNAMEVLSNKIEERHGRGVRDLIFREEFPPLGASEKERCAYTQMITKRMTQNITPEESHNAWFQVQHGIPVNYWHRSDMADKEKYRQCGSIDEFLNLKWRERIDRLTRLRSEGKLWYTQEINDEVLEFAINNQEIEGGRREEDKIYITKIPYQAIRYFRETDAKMKRYYACHCPLVREAILQDKPVSSDVCECSLGHASHYLAGLDRELKGEVLERAIKGDTRCRFVFYLT